VPLIDELEQRLQNVRVRGRGVEDRAEAIEQRACTGDRACIEQRQQELGVVGLETIEVVQLAHLMTDDDAKVPQWVQELAEDLLLVGADAATEQDEQVDVGLETEMAAAIAAQRQYGNVCVGWRDVGEQLSQHRIDAVRVALERSPPARTAQGFRLELGSRGIECRHESGRAGSRLCK
jgi:hypothetical protein